MKETTIEETINSPKIKFLVAVDCLR